MFQDMMMKRNQDRHYIKKLEELLAEHNVELPPLESDSFLGKAKQLKSGLGILEGNLDRDGLNQLLRKMKSYRKLYHVQICFKDISYWTKVPKAVIPTVGTTLRRMVIGSGKKHRVDILKNLTGNCAFTSTYV
jgi:hypothetical protein